MQQILKVEEKRKKNLSCKTFTNKAKIISASVYPSSSQLFQISAKIIP